MKTLTVLALLICFTCMVVAKVNEKCETGADCDEGECCMNLHRFISSRCRKLKQENDFCMLDQDIEHPDDGVYRFMCPCVEGLECKPEEVIEKEDGSKIIRNSKCKTKE